MTFSDFKYLIGSDEWWKGRWKSDSKDGSYRKDGGSGVSAPLGKSSTAGGGSTPRTLTVEAWSSQSRVAVTVDGATVILITSYSFSLKIF